MQDDGGLKGCGRVQMKRALPAFALLAVTAVAQAQTFDERFPKPSRENSSAMEALRHWLGMKAAVGSVTAPAVSASAPKPAHQDAPKPTLVSTTPAAPA